VLAQPRLERQLATAPGLEPLDQRAGITNAPREQQILRQTERAAPLDRGAGGTRPRSDGGRW
jgi:hypothetical protein